MDILSKWERISFRGRFHYILATSSIREVIEYYCLLKDNDRGLFVTAVFDPHTDNENDDIFKDIKERFGDRVQGLTANAKDAHENSQAYDLLHYNFTKTVVLNTKNTAELNEQQFKDALHDTYTTYKDELLRYCQI